MRINDFDTTEPTTNTSQVKDELRAFEAKHSLDSYRPGFYEFFAGGGMVRAGLGKGWDCLFSNDIDAKKAQSYTANFGSDEFWQGDVRDIPLDQLSGSADLAWASSPCQDLSLAGKRAGLDGARSQAFWSFWDHMLKLRAEDRAPKLIALENVTGAVSSRGGADFMAMMTALAGGGYKFGAVVVDAAHFLPHSRQRLFVIAVRDDIDIDPQCVGTGAKAIRPEPPMGRRTEKIEAQVDPHMT